MKPRNTLEKILAGSRNIAFSDMVSLVEAYGFRLDRIKGSHHIFARAGLAERINLQPTHGQVKDYQIRQVMKLIEEHNFTLGESK